MSKKELANDIYINKTIEDLGKIKLRKGKHANESIEQIYNTDKSYLLWHSQTDHEYSRASFCFLEKIEKALRDKGIKGE